MNTPVSPRSTDGQMPTMADVARHAGVSSMSVSRALRDSSLVSEATRARIFKAIDELGYVLDLSAGSLSSKRTGFVAAIVPSINNSNFSDTARGITEGLEGTGLQLLLAYNDYSAEREEGLIEAMLRRRPEGIILTGGIHTSRARRMLQNAGVPVVETWDVPADPIDQVVGFSNSDAMAELVKTLAGKGYRRFGYIGGTTERDTRGNQRREGFRSALNGLGLDSNRVISFGVPPISMEQGGQAIISLLDQWPDTQAAICVSDLSAFGALMECHRRGLKVPEDIAIAGFGNYEIASCCHPRITSVDIECHEIGLLAAQKIIQSIQNPDASERRVPVMTNIRVIEREST
jgi:LacI family transcriptional regulator, gluconate utilization system Gnt-I transcriptional repressor